LTLRAVILGLLGALFVAGAGYINDQYLRVNFMVGNHLPISVFGLLILVMMTVNPLLHLLRSSWRLATGELASVLALVLVACGIPSSGLMRTFTPALIMPLQLNASLTGWRSTRVLDYTPSAMLVGGADPEGAVAAVDGFVGGLTAPGRHIGLDRVPWGAWAAPLAAWLPLVVLMATAVIGLSLLVHHQWAHRERLLYPIAEFATVVIRQDPQRRMAPVFRDRLLWIGLATVLLVRVINGLAVWYPGFGVTIPLSFPFGPLAWRFPTFAATPGAGDIMSPPFYPTAFAFSFFLAGDIAFSVGISRLVFVLLMMFLTGFGVDTSDTYMTGGVGGWMNYGSYIGAAILIGYTGRRYYGQVFKQALTLRPQPEARGYAVWGARILIVSAAGMIGVLIALGLGWPLAVLTVFSILLMFLVLARVNAEAGVFFYKPQWQTPGVLIGLLGMGAMGPKAIIVVGLLTMVLTVDPREALIPFVTNGLKLSDNAGVGPGRTGAGAAAACLLCLAMVVPLALWANYNYGLQPEQGPLESHWATYRVPKFPFDAAEQAVTRLRLQGRLEESVNFSPLQRIWNMNPDNRFLASVGAGLGLVLVASAARLRWTWWPVHPILFLVMSNWSVGTMSLSFLSGWVVKAAVLALGGTPTYRRVRHMMVGVIAGDLLGGLTFMLAGWIYYAATGLMPPSYRIFPG